MDTTVLLQIVDNEMTSCIEGSVDDIVATFIAFFQNNESPEFETAIMGATAFLLGRLPFKEREHLIQCLMRAIDGEVERNKIEKT